MIRLATVYCSSLRPQIAASFATHVATGACVHDVLDNDIELVRQVSKIHCQPPCVEYVSFLVTGRRDQAHDP